MTYEQFKAELSVIDLEKYSSTDVITRWDNNNAHKVNRLNPAFVLVGVRILVFNHYVGVIGKMSGTKVHGILKFGWKIAAENTIHL